VLRYEAEPPEIVNPAHSRFFLFWPFSPVRSDLLCAAVSRASRVVPQRFVERFKLRIPSFDVSLLLVCRVLDSVPDQIFGTLASNELIR